MPDLTRAHTHAWARGQVPRFSFPAVAEGGRTGPEHPRCETSRNKRCLGTDSGSECRAFSSAVSEGFF